MANEKMSINARFEYLRRMQDRHRLDTRKVESRLLDDMEAVTHLGRKHLIALAAAHR